MRVGYLFSEKQSVDSRVNKITRNNIRIKRKIKTKKNAKKNNYTDNSSENKNKLYLITRTWLWIGNLKRETEYYFIAV